jgi:RNA polymerase sigma-70 factor (ECF subfamily)
MNHLRHNPEAENLLWSRVVDDDEKAFEKIFTLFYPALSVYAKKYIEDRAVCEDIVQDTFVSLWEDRKRLLITSSLRNYLTVSVRNHCLNFLKKEGLTRQYRESIRKETLMPDEDPDNIYTLTELYDLLDKDLAGLPDNYRIVFEMHRMEGKKHEEIAEELNLSLRTVKRYQSRAIEILKENLKDYLPLVIITILIN